MTGFQTVELDNVHNSKTGRAHAYIEGASYNVLRTSRRGGVASYNLPPAYYIQAC